MQVSLFLLCMLHRSFTFSFDKFHIKKTLGFSYFLSGLIFHFSVIKKYVLKIFNLFINILLNFLDNIFFFNKKKDNGVKFQNFVSFLWVKTDWKLSSIHAKKFA